MRVRLLAAALGVGVLAGCATGPYTSREPWEVYVQASPQASGLVHVRTFTLAPTDCYTAGEIRSAPSSQAQSIQVQAVLADGRYGGCDRRITEVVHDLPGLQLEPDDRFLEVVVSADGVERNRVLIDIAAAPPVGLYGYDPRYDDRYQPSPSYPRQGFRNAPYGG
jgi:hypothetical protein